MNMYYQLKTEDRTQQQKDFNDLKKAIFNKDLPKGTNKLIYNKALLSFKGEAQMYKFADEWTKMDSN